eukprot:CAMPEP_0117591406 /NCGR_PEP_ID=MMETSP0784-20121206/71516_1 /TAXON_ID=39447 /ORGANISM="" /LENGTH=351 /DNA_ID=CAMNT_0005393127 /DNA_START=84 /DNA_END=1139 /DNA_ORIENTATION=+
MRFVLVLAGATAMPRGLEAHAASDVSGDCAADATCGESGIYGDDDADTETASLAVSLLQATRLLKNSEEAEQFHDHVAELSDEGWGSCQQFGCGARFERWRPCQCNPECKKYHSCCADYAELCDKTESPTPAPEPYLMPNNLTNRSSPCLCGFDIDRTLTAGQHEWCQSLKAYPGSIYDNAYGGGKLKLSELGFSHVQGTRCKECFVAIISRGDAAGSNSKMRSVILNEVVQTDVFKAFKEARDVQMTWSDWGVRCQNHVDSPFVIKSPNECKSNAMAAIVEWYGRKGVSLAKEDVYFFDDHSSNIPYFKKWGFNAREISCHSRGGHIGRCGATLDEITLEKGVKMCHGWA